MLEFYSVPSKVAALSDSSLALPARRPSIPGSRVAISVSLVAAMLLGGCASTPSSSQGESEAAPAASGRPQAPPLPRNAEPPAPAVNLSGFPLAYRQGYADGCGSATGAERKDAPRFSADSNYRTGWQDGLALCRRK